MPLPKKSSARGLQDAIALYDRNLVKELIAAGAPVNARDRDGTTALMSAALVGEEQIFHMLLKAGADPHAADHRGKTVLWCAERMGTRGMVRRLLELGVDPNTPPQDVITTPLMNAVLREPATVELLIQYGADVDMQRRDNGDTALMTAVKAENPQTVEILLRAGADWSIQNHNGEAALDLVRTRRFGSEKRKAAIERLLLEHGATPNVAAEESRAKFFEAADQGDTAVLLEMIDLGVPVNCRNREEKTALMLCARKGHERSFFALIDAGADPLLLRMGSQDLLEEAAAGGSSRIVTYLLDKGFAVDGDDPDSSFRSTPLITAAIHGHYDVAGLLLRAGANPRHRFADETALDYARQYGNEDVAALLLGHGASDPDSDPARAAISGFPQAARQPEFQSIVELMNSICGRGRKWKPILDHGVETDGVHRFTLATFRNIAEYFGEPKNRISAKRKRELIIRLRDHVLSKGYLLILLDHWDARSSAKFGLFPTDDKFAVLTAIGVEGWNYGIGTAHIVEQLREIDRKNPFTLLACAHDYVEGTFAGRIKGAADLAKRLVKLCPSVLEEVEDVKQFGKHLSDTMTLALRWD